VIQIGTFASRNNMMSKWIFARHVVNKRVLNVQTKKDGCSINMLLAILLLEIHQIIYTSQNVMQLVAALSRQEYALNVMQFVIPYIISFQWQITYYTAFIQFSLYIIHTSISIKLFWTYIYILVLLYLDIYSFNAILYYM
jgi:hypothetical protein